MNTIFETIAQLESQLARVKAELHFVRESEAFRCGAEYERHRIVRMILERLQILEDRADVCTSSDFRRVELVALRQAILEVES